MDTRSDSALVAIVIGLFLLSRMLVPLYTLLNFTFFAGVVAAPETGDRPMIVRI